MTTVSTNSVSSSNVHIGTIPSGSERAPVCLSPVELVAMAETGMRGIDDQVSAKMASQRRDIAALKRLNSLKAKMAKYQNGLDNENDGDEKRGGGNAERGRSMRGAEFTALYNEYAQAAKDLPEQYRTVAQNGLKVMDEKRMRQFDTNQANNMMESIEGAISEINTRMQAEMAQINNLISQRSNMIEMTKNISTALAGQQDFITKNAPR